MSSYDDVLNTFNSGRTDGINQMYDARKDEQLSQLENAYQQNLSDAQAAADKINPTYQQKANDLAVQYERNRQNFNNQAAVNGINTGAASQAALAQNSTWQRDYGNLRTAQADAQSEADRGILNLKTQYQNNVQAAIAQNDYERAAALLDEYNNAYSRGQDSAKLLAQFGDFSGFASIYGQEAADNMAAIWRLQNPDIAYNLGQMNEEEYRKLTGKYPPGYDDSGKYNGSPGGPGQLGGTEIYGNDAIHGIPTSMYDKIMGDLKNVKSTSDYNRFVANMTNGVSVPANILGGMSDTQNNNYQSLLNLVKTKYGS